MALGIRISPSLVPKYLIPYAEVVATDRFSASVSSHLISLLPYLEATVFPVFTT